jgi:hypothetical protein
MAQSRKLLALGGLWLVVSAGVVLAPGCYGRNCEGDTMSFGAEPGQGDMIDVNTWESSPADSEWIAFPRQRYYIFDLRALGGRTPELVLPYIAAQKTPNDGTGNATLGAGNLALILNQSSNRVDIKNDTCSDYYIRLVVTAPPVPPQTAIDGGGGGGTNLADASVGDGGKP